MKKISLAVIYLLAMSTLHSQVLKFNSLQSAVSLKDDKGEFSESKEWVGNSKKIELNLSGNVVTIFSKQALTRDQFTLEEKISLTSSAKKSISTGDERILVLDGVDRSGEKCIVRLVLKKDELKINDGVMRIEYLNKIKIFKIRKSDPAD